jgi:hypothetical protein
LTTPPRRPSAAARATRRSRRPAPSQASFLERNRNRLLIAGAAVVFVILAGMAFLNSSQPAYACGSQFDPTPAPSWVPPTAAPVASGASPAPAATPPAPGYVEPDMGHLHVNPGTRVKYANCPPASGKHYNAVGQGPIEAKVYGPDEKTIPQGWLHNMEHGGLVLLYKCPGPACDAAGQAALQELYKQWPSSPICGFRPGLVSPVMTRFDDMPYPYAAVVWDVVLPLQTLDPAAILDFFQRQAEQYNPELVSGCTRATPAPSLTPTAAPSSSLSPTGAPTSTAPASTVGTAPTPAAS